MDIIFPLIIFIITVLLIWSIAISRDKSIFGGPRTSPREGKRSVSAHKPRLSADMLVKVDTEALPIREYPWDGGQERELALAQREVLKLACGSMMCLDADMPDSEKKAWFGAENLDAVSENEDRFKRYNTALARWAGLLLEAGYNEDARAVLEHSVSIKSGCAGSYALLAGIYAAENNMDGLKRLHNAALAAGNLPERRRVAEEIRRGAEKLGGIE